VAHRGRENADEALALAIAQGQTLRRAAEAAGVSERTAGRRIKEAAFRRRVAELQAEMVSRATARLTAGMADAAAILLKLMNSKSESIQLAAARSLLDYGRAFRELGEISERLAALEALAESGKGGAP
jgi:hypothetical protein